MCSFVVVLTENLASLRDGDERVPLCLVEKTRPNRLASGRCVFHIFLTQIVAFAMFFFGLWRFVASFQNFVLSDSIQTNAYYLPSPSEWLDLFSLPVLSTGSQPPRHRVLSQRFVLSILFAAQGGERGSIAACALLRPSAFTAPQLFMWNSSALCLFLMPNYRSNMFIFWRLKIDVHCRCRMLWRKLLKWQTEAMLWFFT